MSSTPAVALAARRPNRPCDACRRRKTRCEMSEDAVQCVLCQFHKQPCTFVHEPPRKKRRTSDGSNAVVAKEASPRPQDISANLRLRPAEDRDREVTASQHEPRRVADYALLKGPSLLKRTLGLQNHRHAFLLGSSSVFESRILELDTLPAAEDIAVGPRSLRKVSSVRTFLLSPDAGTRNHEREVHDLDEIESLVSPHGQALINLYFRIVHPTFPILHKKVFLEKYARTHREFSPPLLAAVYILALNWWSYSADLSLLPMPDAARLEEIAFRTMSDIVHRPKLSTIQAGLLLLQRPEGNSWALTSQLVGLGQDLGLHLDCTEWRIPRWEKGLRKRLAWALFMQDKWGSLVHGRPSHIADHDWAVQMLDESDFPERAADEDDEEGSTEVEKGRVLFCEMIELACIVSDILLNFYTTKAEAELRSSVRNGVAWILERAKPLQLRLKHWFMALPETMRLQDITMRKLSSTGYLHLAYYAAEITLHRRIIHGLVAEQNLELVEVCRAAARERLAKALDFVNSLRPEHLQSFWYSASKYSFALVGTFISLLWATSSSKQDAAFYKEKLDEYRWSLRLSSKNAEILERALTLMGASTGILVRSIPDIASVGTLRPTRELEESETAVSDEDDDGLTSSAFDAGDYEVSAADIDAMSWFAPTGIFDTGDQSTPSILGLSV